LSRPPGRPATLSVRVGGSESCCALPSFA
jgi:hypothetical protein